MKALTRLPLQLCLFTIACLLLQCTAVSGQMLLNPKTQPQFLNALPVPPIIDARSGGTLQVGISQFTQWLGLVDPANGAQLSTTVWGYNGSYPGPTILARKNVPINVFWHNNLVDAQGNLLPHLLPVDPSIHWAFHHDPNWRDNGVPVVSHLHGGHTESASDGLPDAWFTPGFAKKGHGFVKGDTEPYHYSNDQEAATIWYHDHALGLTRLNVYAGLAGYYLITDDNEQALQASGKLPAAPYDLGLAIQDRMFTADGQLHYPASMEDGDSHGMRTMANSELDPSSSVLPEFFGDFILVNGMTWPVLEVEPRQYRFRVLNGSDSRFYNLYLSSGQTITQVATDNGLLPSPVSMTQMLIAPGERKDIVLDFSNPALWGQTIIVRNNAKTPYPKGSAVDPQTTGRIMAFRISKPLNTQFPLTSLPATLRPPIVPLQTALPARKLILFEGTDEHGRLKPMLGTVDQGALTWEAPITENPMLNSTEVWEIYNETMDAHPIHLHLVSMQLLGRQKFTAKVDETTGKPSNIRLVGKIQPPGADEQGWKDTYVMYPGEVTRVIARFDLEGLYVWHCHILSHEDHEMMRPYYVGHMPNHNMSGAMQQTYSAAEQPLNALVATPNPFRQQLELRFSLPKASKVELRILNATGTLVKQVYGGVLAAGSHVMRVDGGGWSNGMYLCELTVDSKKQVTRAVLAR